MFILLDLSAVFVTLGHFLNTWSLQASLTPFDSFPLQSVFLAVLPVSPYTQCGTRFCLPLYSLYDNLMYSKDTSTSSSLLSPMAVYLTAYYMHGHPKLRKSPLPLPQIGCPSFTVWDNTVPDTPGETWASLGILPPPSLLSISLMPRSIM